MNLSDIEFIRDLQRELNTQDDCGQAEPKYWGIMERKTKIVPDGCGEDVRFYFDECDGDFSMDELIEYIQENYVEEMNSEIREEWEDLLESEPSPWCMKHFLESNHIIDEVRYVDVDEVDVLSEQTGAFLTRRAAQEYIDKFGYNHSQPRTYAMTAYRNFELERLLEILKTMDIDEMEKTVKNNLYELYSKIDKGAILEGKVKSISKEGAVIDLGCVDAFLPATEMSWDDTLSPWNVVKKNEIINCVVLDYNSETKEISLGLKQLTPHPNEIEGNDEV